MAFLLPAAAASAFWVFGAYTWSLKKQAELPAEDEIGQTNPPDQGQYEAPDKMTFAETRGRFKSVTETVDVQGARVFLVDWGTGAKSYLYRDPRIVL